SAIASVRTFAAPFDRESPDDTDLIAALFERVVEADVQIQRMTPVPLCLEALFDELGQRLRQTAAGRREVGL
ncbi:MAG: hypothetical protein KY476_07645, partial [Planctomycetes bacterium]|nr:hypothetical protein [Planctomycetota bacterium]